MKRPKSWQYRIGELECFLYLNLAMVIGLASMISAAENGKSDCNVYEARQAHAVVGLKTGDFVFSVGPGLSPRIDYQTAWDRIVQGLISQYLEACGSFNAGVLSREQYERIIGEIQPLYQEAKVLERQLQQPQTGEGPELSRGRALTILDWLHELDQRVEQAATQRGKPLKPKKPCSPTDMLGPPGRSC